MMRQLQRVSSIGWLLLPLLLYSNNYNNFHCSAFVPPKPGTDLAALYEPLEVYRQRRNITFAYRPHALHPETCRYLSEDECRDADASMHRHQQRHRDLQKTLHHHRRTTRQRQQQQQDEDEDKEQVSQEELQYHMAEFQKALHQFAQEYQQLQDSPPTRDEELEELAQLLHERNETLDEAHAALLRSKHRTRNLRDEPAAAQGRNPRVGTFNVLILLLRFSDHQARKLPSRYEYQILWNLRIRKWLTMNSYMNYDAWFEVRPWTTTDQSEKHYAFGQSGRVSAFQESYWPLLDSLDNDPDWDWSRFDIDDNGLLDNLIVLHSGYAAEEGGQDCTNGREFLDRIWSHAFSDSNGWRNKAGTYGVEGYMIASALDLTCDSYPAKMGVMTHEYLHTFYLIDLYDYTFEGKGVGFFDIMAYPYGFQNDGYMPVNLGVWAKTAIDWLECEELTSSGTYTLEPAALSPSCYRITLVSEEESLTGLAEYLLLENRQQVAFDLDFWVSGVIIYHIDEDADEQYNRGMPGQAGWPGNGNHYQVAILQADGNYDMENGENNGDENDMYQPGMSITPNYDGNTYPNTDSYQNGDIQKSGVVIEVLEEEGRNFIVEITLGSRSGGNSAPAALSTPVKEEIPVEAREQFDVPDADVHISGKLPDFPWQDEEGNHQDKEDETEYAIDVLDSVQSSAGERSWGLNVSGALMCLAGTLMML